MDPGTSRASYGNVGLAIAGLVKPSLYLHSFRGTLIDYRNHERVRARHRLRQLSNEVLRALEEFQAAPARIFKGMDANKDGKLTIDEMQTFMQGARRSAPRH
jgi:hypothetical protein